MHHDVSLYSLIISSYYWVSLRYVVVGEAHVKTPVMAIFDTGTTYTYLSSNSYDLVAAAVRPTLDTTPFLCHSDCP